MSLVDTIIYGARRPVPFRAGSHEWPIIDINEWARAASAFWSPGAVLSYTFDREEIDGSFVHIVNRAYKANGIVFAVELARLMLFSQARFVWRRWVGDQPQKGFTDPSLDLLNLQPWNRASTQDLLNRSLQHADFAGTSVIVKRGTQAAPQLRVPRPDWITLLLGSYDDAEADSRDIDAELVGVLYHPGGRYSDRKPVSILASQVAVFTPIPDPLFHYWGVPWVQPIIKNIQSHDAATEHKLRFFENGATPQVIVTLGERAADPDKFRKWVEAFEQEHAGATNAYRTMYLAAGANAQVVGANLRQLSLRENQDIDELAIANAGNVPATIVGLSEGLQGSSLNAGNFGQSMRRFGNLFARPTWQNWCGSVQYILPRPPGAELWYADKHIPALQEDIKDQATVLGLNATAMRTLSDGGWKPDDVVRAVTSGDLSLLVNEHSGLLPVQLQPPTDGTPPSAADVTVSPGIRALLGDGEVRCGSCGKLVARALGPGSLVECRGCGANVTA